MAWQRHYYYTIIILNAFLKNLSLYKFTLDKKFNCFSGPVGHIWYIGLDKWANKIFQKGTAKFIALKVIEIKYNLL